MSAVRSIKGRPTPPPPSRAEQKLRAFHEEGAIGKAYDGRLARRLLPYVLPHGKFVVISLTTLGEKALQGGEVRGRRNRSWTKPLRGSNACTAPLSSP